LGAGYHRLRPADADVRGWWRRWPAANVGVLLEPAGLLVVDLDGRAAVAEADALGCPATYTVRRGDHLHAYYARPVDLPPGRTTHRGASRAIDVLGGGLIVGAGSRHASGDTYEVARDLPLVPAPAWAVAMLRARPAARAAAPTGTATPATDPAALARLRAALPPDVRAVLDGGAPDGARSEAEWRVLLAAVRAGMTDAEITGGGAAPAGRCRGSLACAPAWPRGSRPT
jgi:hypothetical protein